MSMKHSQSIKLKIVAVLAFKMLSKLNLGVLLREQLLVGEPERDLVGDFCEFFRERVLQVWFDFVEEEVGILVDDVIGRPPKQWIIVEQVPQVQRRFSNVQPQPHLVELEVLFSVLAYLLALHHAVETVIS